MGNIADLVKFPLESTSLFTVLSQLLCIPAESHLDRLQVLLQRLYLSAQL